MSALANHPFVKMNGLGNEIVVVDMRAAPAAITPADARAAAAPNGAPYDQLMALYPPRTPGTDAFVRIFNNDGSESGACGNGTRCIADIVFKETRKDALTFETPAGLVNCWKGAAPLTFTVDMGPPRFGWRDIPLAREMDTDRVDLARRRRRRRPRLRELPQHRVHETRCPPRLQLLRQLHGLVDRRMRRDLPVVEELEGAEAQGDAHRVVEILQRAVAVRRQRPVELELPAQGPVRQLRRQRHLARLEGAGLPQRRVEREVGERTVLRDAHQDLGRDPPRWRRHARLLSRGKAARPGFALIPGPQPR